MTHHTLLLASPQVLTLMVGLISARDASTVLGWRSGGWSKVLLLLLLSAIELISFLFSPPRLYTAIHRHLSTLLVGAEQERCSAENGESICAILCVSCVVVVVIGVGLHNVLSLQNNTTRENKLWCGILYAPQSGEHSTTRWVGLRGEKESQKRVSFDQMLLPLLFWLLRRKNQSSSCKCQMSCIVWVIPTWGVVWVSSSVAKGQRHCPKESGEARQHLFVGVILCGNGH